MKPQKVLPLQNNRTLPKGTYPFNRLVCRWHTKRPQPWAWAQEHEERVRKHWRWRLLDAMWGNRKAQLLQCVPFALYKWKAFGFDGEHQPMWTIADYMSEWYEYENQSTGLVDSRGRP
jgi:hypothetical protein